MGYVITLELFGVRVVVVPEQNHRYDVHKSAVYPFRCVAEQVAARMKRFTHWPHYQVEEVRFTTA